MTSHQPSNLHGSASLADQDRGSRPSICLSAGCMLRSNCPMQAQPAPFGLQWNGQSRPPFPSTLQELCHLQCVL